ncbi:hypothetical protein [Okeania sp.]|uniref:hypothetical protein n=1 Tax=Okeania sp. TaxID=3100323 RepID=UPI002B4B8D37|nr:hypothetical protein [Okeania sp.]MEB3342343.1 hypothetical protein [Okeania sp.]
MRTKNSPCSGVEAVTKTSPSRLNHWKSEDAISLTVTLVIYVTHSTQRVGEIPIIRLLLISTFFVIDEVE